MKAHERTLEAKRQAVMAKKVKDALYQQEKTRVWLIKELEKEGIYTCATEMSEALHNARHGKKVMTVLNCPIALYALRRASLNCLLESSKRSISCSSAV